MHLQTTFFERVFLDVDINPSFISTGKFPDIYQSDMHHHLQTTG